MSVSNVMWVEKYRPKKISDLVNQKEIMGSLNALLKNQSEIPHLLFSGSAERLTNRIFNCLLMIPKITITVAIS